MTDIEILDSQYTSRSEAAPVLNRALKNFHTVKRTTLQVMADLRTLQDRGAHLLYGEQNFATWAEQTFDGLQASNIKQLTRAGGVALELERRGLIKISKGANVGSTGLRELSVVANSFGNDKMVEAYLTARKMVIDEGRDVSDQTVKAAMRLLMPPTPTDLEIPDALDTDGEDEEELEEDDDESNVSKAMSERIDHIRDLSWDLPDTLQELGREIAALDREVKGEATADDLTWLDSGR